MAYAFRPISKLRRNGQCSPSTTPQAFNHHFLLFVLSGAVFIKTTCLKGIYGISPRSYARAKGENGVFISMFYYWRSRSRATFRHSVEIGALWGVSTLLDTQSQWVLRCTDSGLFALTNDGEGVRVVMRRVVLGNVLPDSSCLHGLAC